MTQELKNLVHQRADAVQQRYHRHGPLFRAVWLVSAFVVIAAGLLMTVVPGPAIIVIPIGLAMLAARFRWAQRLLRATIDYGVTFQRRLSKVSFGVKAAVTLTCAVIAAALVFVLSRWGWLP